MLHSHILKRVEPIETGILLATFADGVIKKYNVNTFAEKHTFYKRIVNDKKVFCEAHIILSGDAVAWDDMHDISSEEIYDQGVTMSMLNNL